jgi:hypothetical protein
MGEQSGMIKSAKGVLVVWNEPGNYYTIEIQGEEIVPASQPLMFQVDGTFFQIQTVPKKAFLKGSNDKPLDDKGILAAHRDWEGDYISKILKTTLRIDSEWLKLPNNMDALAWSYDMPKKMFADQSAKRQLYLAVVKRDHVFLLNGAVTDNDDEKILRQLLLDTMNTLKPSDKPLSLEKAKEQVMKDN